MRHKIAVLLDGPIENDGRVMRVVNSLSGNYSIDLYTLNGKANSNLFNEQVRIIPFSGDTGWFKTNIAFHTKFSELRKVLQENLSAYNAIYCNDYPLLQTAVDAKKAKPSIRLIYDSHELYIATLNQFFPSSGMKSIYGLPLIWLNRFLHGRREKRLVKSANLIITVGESIAEAMQDLWKVRDILVLKNCPNLASIPTTKKSLRNYLGLTEKHQLLLYQGVLNKGRGVEKLISIAPQLSENIHIVIVGDGPILEELKSSAADTKNVHFTGRLPFSDLLFYTKDTDAGIMLIQPLNRSKELALPNKLFEYMAAEIPFITNNLVESKRILHEVDGGYVVEDSDLNQLTDAINTIFADPEQMRSKGVNGKKIVLEKYHWEFQSKQLLERINTLFDK